MKRKVDETKIAFRVWDGEIVAIMPEEPGSRDEFTCLSYAHVGQHGHCDPLLAALRSTPARPTQYAELLAELEGLGYQVRVVTKLNRYSWLQTRRAKIAAESGGFRHDRVAQD